MKKYLNSVEEVVKALKEGKKVKDEQNEDVYQMVDGIIYGNYNSGEVVINDSIVFTKTNLSTEEPEPLKFEVNRAYKVKCGQKVFISLELENPKRYGILSSKGFYCVDYNGKSLLGEDKWDIVGYWEEEK